jgi:hypothetical protein
VEVLPLLAYTAPWAASIKGHDKSPPRSVEEWRNFVEQLVARYRVPPFALRYFQIWNEPTREAGFWEGASNQEFIDRVFLPAAQIIRAHGGMVVYGGWPASNSLEEFNQLLAYHNAWEWTDILDVHYYGNAAWQPLYEKWILTGRCRGIWQTEVGFVSTPDFLPALYWRALAWALRSAWAFPDQYKLFWYAGEGKGAEADKCLAKPDADGRLVLTKHGEQLAVMSRLLAGGPLAPFSDFTTIPLLGAGPNDKLPAALGFRVGANRVLIVLLLGRAMFRGSPTIAIEVTLNGPLPRVETVSCFGERHSVPTEYDGRRLRVSIPVRVMMARGETSPCAVTCVQIDQ